MKIVKMFYINYITFQKNAKDLQEFAFSNKEHFLHFIIVILVYSSPSVYTEHLASSPRRI